MNLPIILNLDNQPTVNLDVQPSISTIKLTIQHR